MNISTWSVNSVMEDMSHFYLVIISKTIPIEKHMDSLHCNNFTNKNIEETIIPPK